MEDKVEFGHCKSIFRDNGEAIPSPNMGDDKSYTTDWLANETIRFPEKQDRKGRAFSIHGKHTRSTSAICCKTSL